ncbi:hypothetical protein FRC07_013210, partial [Ceratobasidium sp. 392]
KRARRMEVEKQLEQWERKPRALRRQTESGGEQSAGRKCQELRSRNAQREDELNQVRESLEKATEALDRSSSDAITELKDKNLARRKTRARPDMSAQLGEERDDVREELYALHLVHE